MRSKLLLLYNLLYISLNKTIVQTLFIPLITHIYEKRQGLFQTSNKILYIICIIVSILESCKQSFENTYPLSCLPVIYPGGLQLPYDSDTQILLELWFPHIMSKKQLSSSFGQLSKARKNSWLIWLDNFVFSLAVENKCEQNPTRNVKLL